MRTLAFVAASCTSHFSKFVWWTGARAWLATLLTFAVAACGGDSKDSTGKTDHEFDASTDGGPDSAGAEESSDASSVDASAGSVSADSGRAESTSATTSPSATSTSGDATTTSNDTTTESTLPPGWLETEPPAEGLTNCAAKSETDDTSCSYQVMCGDTLLSARCESQGDTWDCRCTDGELPLRNYTLEGVAGSSACEVSIPLCAPGRTADPEPVCETETAALSAGTCSAAESCHTTIELKQGVAAVALERFGYADCNEIDGFVTCSCRDSYAQAQASDMSLEEACLRLVPWCKAGFPPANETTETVCSYNSVSFGEDYCAIDRSCGFRLDADEGYFVYNGATRSVSCESSGCACSSAVYLSAQASGDLRGERCEVMEEFCYTEVTATPTGEVLVKNLSTQGGESTCTGFAELEQWVTWAEGRSVGLSGSIQSTCTRAGGNTWSCSCESGAGTYATEAFEREGQDFEEACEGSLGRCVARARIDPVWRENAYGFWFEFLAESAEADAGSDAGQ